MRESAQAYRRVWQSLAIVAVALVAATGWSGGRGAAAREANVTLAPTAQMDDADTILALAREAMARYHLRAVLLQVTIDGNEVITVALGESMTGVPATTEMHFRNGAVAIYYLATLLLRFVDLGLVGLDDPISRWLPELPDSDRVTLRMLANMTAGYPDYVRNQPFVEGLLADPFKQFTPQDLIAAGLSTPRVFAPGTNWDYSHTDYVILGQALERIGGRPMAALMQEYILDPLGLTGTVGSSTPAIPEPVLHSFTSERREFLGIPAGTRFYEESTFWNPSWTLAEGAIQTTTLRDLTKSAVAMGEGTLLSPASHRAQIAPSLLGFGAPLQGCPNCHTLDEAYNYGLGVVRSGNWLLQNPSFFGYAVVMAYLPARRATVAIALTYAEEAFDAEGISPNANLNLFRAVGAYLAPDSPPLIGR